MPDQLPPNLREAYETELAGLEARLARADSDDQRARLQANIDTVRATLGTPAPARNGARRAAGGRQARPADGPDETRG